MKTYEEMKAIILKDLSGDDKKWVEHVFNYYAVGEVTESIPEENRTYIVFLAISISLHVKLFGKLACCYKDFKDALDMTFLELGNHNSDFAISDGVNKLKEIFGVGQ